MVFSLEDLERAVKAQGGLSYNPSTGTYYKPTPQPPALNPFAPLPEQHEALRSIQKLVGAPVSPSLAEIEANPALVLGPGERFATPQEIAMTEAANAQAQALANEMANKAAMKGKHKYGFFGPSSTSHGTPRTETMLEQGARHHPIVGGLVSNVVVPAIGMVVAGPVGAISAGATYGAVEHGPEGIPSGAIRGAIYAALAPTAGEALGVNPEGLGGTITGLNGPSLLNQLGVSSAPAIGGGIGLFGNLGEVGLVEQTLAPTIQIASSTTAPIVATSTTAVQSINLALTAAEAISSVVPVIGYSYANQLTEPRTTSALQGEQRKKRRKDFYRSIIGMGFGAFVASVSAPFLLAGQSSFVIALGEGAIFGSIASGISRRNAAQGAFEGAFFAGLGNIVDRGLSHSEYLSEAKRLREALGAAASSTVYIIVHDGKLEDVLIGAGSSALSNFLVPSVTGSVNEETLRVFVTGTVTSLMHRTELAQSLVAAGLGSVQARIQRIARQYGNDIAMSQQARRRPKPITNDKAEKHESSKPKIQDDTWRSNSLNVATQKASEVLKGQNIQVPEKRIRQEFEKQPILQGSREDVQRNLIALGKTDGPARGNVSALKRGLEKVFLAVLNTLVGEVHASENSSTSRSLPQQRSKVSRTNSTSFEQYNSAMNLTEHSENIFTNPNYEDLNVDTRSLGLLQAIGGAGQITVAPSTGPFSPVLGAIGIDNIITGFQTLWTGEHHSTSLFYALNGVGESTGLFGPQGASYIEVGLNIVSTVNPRTLTFAFRPGATSTSQTIRREMFSEVGLVRRSLEKSNQSMLRM